MNTEHTRELVTAMFERWEQAGDTGPFLAALADDLFWTVTGSSPDRGPTPARRRTSRACTAGWTSGWSPGRCRGCG
jgi:ketosteroid isomerase-like protein